MNIAILITNVLMIALMIAILYQLGKVQITQMRSYKETAKSDKIRLIYNTVIAMRLETGAICDFLKSLTPTVEKPTKAPAKKRVLRAAAKKGTISKSAIRKAVKKAVKKRRPEK